MTKLKYFSLLIVCLIAQTAMAQGHRISGTVSSSIDGPLMMANVVEKDANNRIVEACVTDINGNFSMMIKNPKDKLTFSYIGCKSQVMPIGSRTVFKVTLTDATALKEIVIKAKPRIRTNGLAIPEKEVSVAQQTLNMSDVEGLAFTSADEALQGKIAGLDIVANSGNLGAGTSMRLRGVTTINGNAEPLIVVDGNIFDNPDATFDFTNANEESYSALLSVNPDDIESITVMKDAGATAQWGSRGANGVISIKTKRGARGKTRVEYSYRFTGSWQPKGYNLLNGDDYTMLMKEEFYNPSQSASATTSINELNYNKSWSEYENWNNNTDWVGAVTQFGTSHNHYLTISGGGEKANFRMSAGYDKETGTIIKQSLDRFSTRLVLDYFVSDRIKFSTNFALTYTNNQKNYDDNILSRAQQIAPNMSIYRQDANGNDTNEYYTMLPSGNSTVSGQSSKALSSIRDLGNPVAIANLAWRDQKTYRITPQFQIDYDLLGKDEGTTMLKYTGMVYMDIFSESTPKYWPGSLTTNDWTSYNTDTNIGYNTSTNYDYNSLAFTTRHTLTFTPHFNNEDWTSTMLGQWEMKTGNSNSQTVIANVLPNDITSPTVESDLRSMSSSNSQWRSLYGLYSGHIAYKSKYAFDITLRADGSTKYGKSSKWGFFPGISARWNINDEKFMKFTSKWLSMLSFRPSWGIVGNQPKYEYLQYSKYATSGVYGSGTNNATVTYIDGMQLADLKWEKTSQYNLGGNFGFFDDLITGDFNYYYKRTKGLLMESVGIPSSTGFSSLAYKNVGVMDNKGWELNIDANKFLKIGKFSMSANFNIAQNFNQIKEMDESVLQSINSEWTATDRGTYLNRIQVGNPVGSIYGLRFKGVYQYNYDWLINYQKSNNLSSAELEDYINNKFLASGKTAPIALDNNGHVLMNSNGTPVHMVYNYSDGSQTYTFQGGDAIYEDVNHDGQINSLDIVYLGNSNPKVNGGFGLNFYYGNWTLKANFNYRWGNKVVNTAKMNLEKMYNAYNQSSAVNWRWRKNGDVTEMPRAMYDCAYNWLGSDRYVEDGSFLRFQYCQLGYKFDTKFLKQIGLERLTLYASANNLFCWSKYSGTDPEHNPGSWGICYDTSQTPRSKSFTLSLNVQF
jgi:TonB-linked SusC/RagA family outer membrane protein